MTYPAVIQPAKDREQLVNTYQQLQRYYAVKRHSPYLCHCLSDMYFVSITAEAYEQAVAHIRLMLGGAATLECTQSLDDLIRLNMSMRENREGWLIHILAHL